MSSVTARRADVAEAFPAQRAAPRLAAGAWCPIVLMLGGAATICVLYATPFGTGTGWDQVMYIGAARNLLVGRGLSIPWGTDAGQPLTHFPPLFPLVLAAIGTLSVDPWDGARYLNAVLRGINLLLIAFLAARLCPGSLIAPAMAGFLFFTSVHMASLHGQAWSEPLFLAVCFSALFLVAGYLHAPAIPRLLAAGALTALAVLTRYVGLAIVLTGAILILSRPTRSRRGKLRDLIIFGAASCGPLALWAVRNRLSDEPALGYRTFAWHPVQVSHLGQLVYVVMDWFVPNQVVTRVIGPGGIATPLGSGVLVAGLVTLICVGFWLLRGRPPRQPPTETAQWFAVYVLPVFVVSYVVAVLAARSFFDTLVELDSRTLAPIYVSAVLLIAALSPRVITLSRKQSALRVALAAVAILVASVYTFRFVETLRRAHEEGISFASKKYLTSVVITTVEGLPTNVSVYSNAPEAIYILTNRDAYWIPDAGLFGETTSLIHKQLEAGRAVYVAYFNDEDIAYRRLTPANLEGVFDLQLVAEDAHGSLGRVLARDPLALEVHGS